MKLKIIPIIVVILLIYSTQGLELQTNAHIKGDGEMYCYTSNNGLGDFVNGTGDQAYERKLDSKEEGDIFESSYIYNREASLSAPKGLNRHNIVADSSLGLKHFVSVSSNKTTNSKAEIIQSDHTISTDFSITSGWGHLTEGLNSFKGSGAVDVAKTGLIGEFEFNSKMSDQVERGLDAIGLRYKLDLVKDQVDIDISKRSSGQKALQAETGVLLDPEQEALAYYNKAYELTSEADDEENDTKKSYLYKQAFDSIEESIDVNPKDDLAWNLKGDILKGLESYKDAAKAYDESLKLKYTLETQKNKAHALFFSKSYKEAIEVYKEVVFQDPADDLSWNNYGKSLYYLGMYEKALEAYERALKIVPEDPLVLYNKGLALREIGDKNGAIKSFNDAINLGLESEDASYAQIAHNYINENSNGMGGG